jgi:hypothetical protein
MVETADRKASTVIVNVDKYLFSHELSPREQDRERCERLVGEAQRKGFSSPLLIGRYAGMLQAEVILVLGRIQCRAAKAG